jgi:thymidylate synthase
MAGLAQSEKIVDLSQLTLFKDLIIGNPESNVGICTLWTQKALIAQKLDSSQFFICANLYSFAGLNFMLRNIFLFPQIRYLILCGADQSRSGEALATFFEEGINEEYSLPGFNGQAKLDQGFPLEALQNFRQSVQLIDLRPEKTGLKNPEAIANRIKEILPTLPPRPPFAEPEHYPESQPEGGKPLPSEATGFRVEGATVAETWLELLKLVMRFGQIKPTDYSQLQRELFNTVAVITEENPDDIFFAPWLPFSRDELENYYPRVLTAQKIPGVSYTYGERLRNYKDSELDQIAMMKARLREAHHTRRAVAVTWDAFVDGESDNPPCLLEVGAGVQQGKLYMTARFRSHDLYTAWPQNTFALRRLQKEIADDVGLPLGPLTIISHSAHIYADKWKYALDVVTSFEKKKIEWRSDPRGYFVIGIRPEDQIITVQHATLEGFSPFYFEGKSARQLCLEIAREKLAALDEHYAYLGRELMKAEIALKMGLSYIQDKDLPL